MSDVIDFNSIKNKVREKEVDDFENYIMGLYYEVAEGKMSYAELNDKILKYVKDNEIPNEKFIEMQKKLISRYGYSMEDIERQMKDLKDPYIESANLSSKLKNKYGESLESTFTIKKYIKNGWNNLTVYGEDEEVYIFSHQEINFNDNELNEYLVSYKNQIGGKDLQIFLCENFRELQY